MPGGGAAAGRPRANCAPPPVISLSVFHKDIVKELGVAQWAYEAGQMAGWGTQNLTGFSYSIYASAGD